MPVLVGTFSWAKIDERKARERELAKFDETSRVQKAEKVGALNPTRDTTEGKYREGKEKTPVTAACPKGSLEVKHLLQVELGEYKKLFDKNKIIGTCVVTAIGNMTLTPVTLHVAIYIPIAPGMERYMLVCAIALV